MRPGEKKFQQDFSGVQPVQSTPNPNSTKYTIKRLYFNNIGISFINRCIIFYKLHCYEICLNSDEISKQSANVGDFDRNESKTIAL